MMRCALHALVALVAPWPVLVFGEPAPLKLHLPDERAAEPTVLTHEAPAPKSAIAVSTHSTPCLAQADLCFDRRARGIRWEGGKELMPEVPGMSKQVPLVGRHNILFEYSF
jgi:hypothetical protein